MSSVTQSGHAALSPVMRAFLAALAFLGLASCSAQDVVDRAVGQTSGTGLVHGRVVWIGGSPGPSGGLGGAHIFFTPEKGGHAFSAVTDSGGSYSLRLPPGAYAVGFSAWRPLPQGDRRIRLLRGDVLELDFRVPSAVVFG